MRHREALADVCDSTQLLLRTKDHDDVDDVVVNDHAPDAPWHRYPIFHLPVIGVLEEAEDDCYLIRVRSVAGRDGAEGRHRESDDLCPSKARKQRAERRSTAARGHSTSANRRMRLLLMPVLPLVLMLVLTLAAAVPSGAQAPVILTGAPRAPEAVAEATSEKVSRTFTSLVPQVPAGDKAATKERVNAALEAIRAHTRQTRFDPQAYGRMLNEPAVRGLLDDPAVSVEVKRGLMQSATELATNAARANAADYWAGAQVAYRVNGEGGITENLSVAGHLAFQAWAPPVKRLREARIHGKRVFKWVGDFELPFYTNVARPNTADGDSANVIAERNARELLAGSEGIHFGAAPFIRWGGVKSAYYAQLFGSAAWRTNAVRAVDTSKTVSLEQLRVSGGLRLGIGDMKIGSAPASLTVEFFQSQFLDKDKYQEAFGTSRKRLAGVETNFILPFGDQLALLVNHVAGRSSQRDAFLRLGVIIKRPEGS